MNRLFTLMLMMLIAVSVANAQSIVKKEYLEENHSGMISESKNNGGETLYYEFVFLKTEAAAYKWDDAGATRGSIKYRLDVYSDAGKANKIITMPIRMRNLITTYYVDVVFNKKDFPDESLREKSATMIFKKDVHWARTKFVPHTGCQRENSTWDRIDEVESYEQLMKYLIRQLDNNIDFSCYK
jgi:hypothetical protein